MEARSYLKLDATRDENNLGLEVTGPKSYILLVLSAKFQKETNMQVN